jgi:hypothetical protein
MKTKSIWVVSLAGEHVFHGHTTLGVIESISDLNIIREQVKDRHGILFTSDEDTVQYHASSYRSYNNVSDNRDITLVAERTTLYANTPSEYIILLTDRCDHNHRYFRICTSLATAQKTACAYEKCDKWHAEIYEKGDDLK